MEQDIQITIIDRDGEAHIFTVPVDMNLNLMEVCQLNELPVLGACGGMAMCATCQVYVESAHTLKDPADAELEMLDQAFFVKDNSRLGCQLFIQPSLDGLVVRLAPESN